MLADSFTKPLAQEKLLKASREMGLLQINRGQLIVAYFIFKKSRVQRIFNQLRPIKMVTMRLHFRCINFETSA